MTRRYWVLGGGSLKGAWQVGAMAEAQALGFEPDGATCTSVGALNGAHMAMTGDAEETAQFWLECVTSPKTIVRKRRWYELGYRFLTKSWAGFVDVAPLEALIREEFSTEVFATADVFDCRVSSVNTRTGQLEYHTPADTHFIDGVLASTAEPIAMPARKIKGDWHVDGGIREVAPLRESIKAGADQIIVFCCQPVALGEWTGNYGDLMAAVGRDVGIVSDETLRNDLHRCELINQLLDAFGSVGPLASKRKLDVRVVFRSHGGPRLDILKFDSKDIAAAIQQGRNDTRRALSQARV